MKIGYAYWGHICNKLTPKSVNTPDGCYSYVPSIIVDCVKRNIEFFQLQQDRDLEIYQTFKRESFNNFTPALRSTAYQNMQHDVELTQNYDVIILEWRMRIPGRNCEIEKDDLKYQPDLDQQERIVEYCKTKNIPLIVFDLDHKFTLEDEIRVNPTAIFETSLRPLRHKIERTSVYIPFNIDTLIQAINSGNLYKCNHSKKSVYIGSRYERDEIIDKYIAPVQDKFNYEVEFYGNWRNYPKQFAEAVARWPSIKYMNRISIEEFKYVYSDAITCPLLAKKSYIKHGFMTARIFEALYSGTLPVGLSEFWGIHEFLPDNLIISDGEDYIKLLQDVDLYIPEKRYQVAKRIAQRLHKMDASNFINKVLEVI